MPLTEKGTEIMKNMKSQYGEEKGKEVFYASKNAGKITGVDDMNGGTEGLKTYGDAEHVHKIEGKTGPAIADDDDKKSHDAFGLKHEVEEPAAGKVVPKAADNVHGLEAPGSFPHDPYSGHKSAGKMEWHTELTCAQMKSDPLHRFKE